MEEDPFLDSEEILSDKWIGLAKDLVGEIQEDRLYNTLLGSNPIIIVIEEHMRSNSKKQLIRMITWNSSKMVWIKNS